MSDTPVCSTCNGTRAGSCPECGGTGDEFYWEGYCTRCECGVSWENDHPPETKREAVCHACDKALHYEEGVAAERARVVAMLEEFRDNYVRAYRAAEADTGFRGAGPVPTVNVGDLLQWLRAGDHEKDAGEGRT